jgi:glycosyltransferase 2 family protein
MQFWEKYKTPIKLIISILALAFLIYKVDTDKLLTTFSQVNLILIVLALLYYIVNAFFNYITLHILFKNLKKKISVWQMLESFWYAASIGQFFPGTMGELSLAKILKDKKGIKYGTTLSVYLLDKIISLIILIIIGIFGVFIFFPNESKWFFGTGIVLICAIIGLLLLANKQLRNFIRKKILRKHAEKFAGFSNAFDELIHNQKKAIFQDFLVTFFRLFLLASITSFMFLEYGFLPSVFLILIVNSIAVMSRLIPISLGGIGFREGIAVLLLASQGVDTAIATTVYVLITIVSLTLNGLYFIIRFNFSRKDGLF